MKRLICILSIALTAGIIHAQVITTQVCKPDIRTLRVKYADNNLLERPFLTLSGDEVLDISFDEMSHSTHLYTYTLLHLNADFTKSDLLTSEYLDGFTTADITDYDHSSLTQILYTHYRFEFPNDDMRPKVSGNYAIKIYEDGNPDDVVAYVTFQVSEQACRVATNVRGDTDKEFNQRYQQLELDIDLQKNRFNTPEEITVVVKQNNRQDNAVVLRQPNYINGNILTYKHNKALIFEGGNEYRRLDISSEYIMGANVDYIDFVNHNYHAYLFADENKATLPYVSERDANGQYIINAERRDDDDYEADYMYVHFLLPASEPWFTGAVYVIGDFCLNQLSGTNRMNYDNDHKCYTYTTLLKQGGYEYQYVLKEKGKASATTLMTEGSHWQTNNEYTIYVYYRPFGCRYDRLLAVHTTTAT